MRRSNLDYLARIHDLFSAFAPVTTRAMFGGHGIYRDGVILGLLIDDAPFLKVDDATRATFEAAGCAPFMYQAKGKSIPMSYWNVPDDALDSPQAFRPWAQRAWEAALRKPLAKKTAKKSSAKKVAAKKTSTHLQD